MLRYLIPLLVAAIIVGCSSNTTTISLADVPTTGDPVRGEQLYYEPEGMAPACSNCHRSGTAAAPALENYTAVAGERVEGQSAREYTFYAIAEPAQHIVEGYGNAMYNRYDESLTPQQIADLIAYLLEE